MQNKLAIITGGNGYLGRAVTKELQSRGWEVAVLSRSSMEFACDVTDVLSIKNAVEKVVRQFGPITAAIHAAALPLERVVKADASSRDLQNQNAVSVTGAKNLYDAVLPHMEPAGIFVAITSDATKNDNDLKMGAYVDAKREMEQFVKNLQAPFRTELFSVGFLPGGLNNDLPEQVRTFFGAKSKPVEEVAKEIANLCEL
jgi:NAD(P)-dependent dehydrogenase (short-subunit alcohol dehydrogenase family)